VFISLGGPGPSFNIWDTQAKALVYSNYTIGGPVTSIDGNLIVYITGGRVGVFNRASNTTWQVASSFYTFGPMNTSSDGRWLVYSTGSSQPPLNGDKVSQVNLYDLVMRTNLVISQSYASGQSANGASDSPNISGNGRFVAFRSDASNLVPNDANGSRNIFLFDRTNNSTTLISVNQSSALAANSHSMLPVFSADGQALLFQSWSSDFIPQDGNFNSDVFAYGMVTNAAGQPFFAQIVAGGQAGGASMISWPAVPGKTYTVQYKNNVTDAGWQSISGGISIVGSQGYFTDPAPSSSRRFYRIVAF
jgi:hypothetical protein